jgi:predicted transcriptional regulator
MGPRCETVGKLVLPVFRAFVAKELVNTHKLTQVEAAEKLGTTQAAISQYVNSKRALKRTEEIEGLLPQIQIMARETARRLANKEITAAEANEDFCDLCTSFCKKKEAMGTDYAI